MQANVRGNKVLLTVVAGIVGAIAVAAPALATTKNVGGGTWTYGVAGNWNFSNYYHPSLRHQSSVSNGEAGVVRSGCVGAGTTSRAEEVRADTGNKAYWSVDACN